MKVKVEVAERVWQVDMAHPLELAIPLNFEGSQARAFGLPRAQSSAFAAGDFIGDRRRGGSANCETLQITPHGNGTHTECVGHITEERIYLSEFAVPPLIPATVLTVSCCDLGESGEAYGGDWAPDDSVITGAALEAAWGQLDCADEFRRALVLRIGSASQRFESLADHSGTNPPFLTTEAVRWLRSVGCDHLLVELPSVDRESDGGALPNHHRFFGVEPGRPADEEARRRSITEMIAVDSNIDDGPYILALQFPRLQTDAAPSRPILYAL